MNWPERPTCHDDFHRGAVFDRDTVRAWRPADTSPTNDKGSLNRFYRTCGFCGCIHPEDLVKVMEAGEIQSSERADMKYGYPHKVYVRILSPWRGQPRVISRKNFGPEEDRVTWGVISDYEQVKFYTAHLYDAGFDEVSLGKMLQALTTNSSNIAVILREIGEGGKQVFQFKFKRYERPEYLDEVIRRMDPSYKGEEE